jgi:hypothetical protein
MLRMTEKSSLYRAKATEARAYHQVYEFGGECVLRVQFYGFEERMKVCFFTEASNDLFVEFLVGTLII